MKLCKSCHYLRTDIQCKVHNDSVARLYGDYTNPCNRYPQNIMRATLEPACGEFKRRFKQWLKSKH